MGIDRQPNMQTQLVNCKTADIGNLKDIISGNWLVKGTTLLQQVQILHIFQKSKPQNQEQ